MAALGHMAEQSGFVSHETPAPLIPSGRSMSDESEAEPESDSNPWPQPPEDEASPEPFPTCARPVDLTKLFGYGCQPISQVMHGTKCMDQVRKDILAVLHLMCVS
jgi:hypothetical protein